MAAMRVHNFMRILAKPRVELECVGTLASELFFSAERHSPPVVTIAGLSLLTPQIISRIATLV